jgi:hypothetical protein
MEYSQIGYEVSDRVATITLDRPEKLNAFTGTMMREMIDAFDRVDADDGVRAVIVTGAGRAYFAGASCRLAGDHGPRGERGRPRGGGELPREAAGALSGARQRRASRDLPRLSGTDVQLTFPFWQGIRWNELKLEPVLTDVLSNDARVRSRAGGGTEREKTMTTILMEKLIAGDVIEVKTSSDDGDDVMTVLVLHATDEFLILDPCDDSTPIVVKSDELVEYRKFDAGEPVEVDEVSAA